MSDRSGLYSNGERLLEARCMDADPYQIRIYAGAMAEGAERMLMEDRWESPDPLDAAELVQELQDWARREGLGEITPFPA